MIFLKAFLFVGLVSLVGEIILNNTKLTPGHITSIFVVLGAFLSFLGVYKYLIDIFPIASSIPIISFGNLLYQSALDGFYQNGFLGLFANMLCKTSGGITEAIIFSFIITIFFRAKD